MRSNISSTALLLDISRIGYKKDIKSINDAADAVEIY